MRLLFVYSFILILFCFGCNSKKRFLREERLKVSNEWYNSSEESENVFHRRVLKTSNDYDSYRFQNLRAVLGGLNAIIRATEDDFFIKEQIQIIDDIVKSARISSEIPENVSFKDNYKGWVSLDSTRLYGEEIVLNEGYAFFYITEFLYYQKESGWVSQSMVNRAWWEEKVRFIEDHIWTKWYTRSIKYNGNPYRYFLRGRTHMGSHWAGIAMYLEKITFNSEIRDQCETLHQSYDLLLRKNFRPHPLDKRAYVWNSTYDDVSGTFAIKVEKSLIQDVSHGNHVVAYIVAAYEMGNNNWKRNDIRRLCNTVKVIYNRSENRFYDNVDRSKGTSRTGWGNFQADGWVKLYKYDPEVKKIFYRFVSDHRILTKYNQKFQIISNMAY